MKKSLTLSYFFCLLTVSCFENACSEHSQNIVDLATLRKDSVYSICKDVYLWNENLPESNEFGLDRCSDAESVLYRIRQYSPFVGIAPIDKWSFAILKAKWSNLVNGKEKDFGFELSFVSGLGLVVSYVHHLSPAGLAGISRGDVILEVERIKIGRAHV